MVGWLVGWLVELASWCFVCPDTPPLTKPEDEEGSITPPLPMDEGSVTPPFGEREAGNMALVQKKKKKRRLAAKTDAKHQSIKANPVISSTRFVHVRTAYCILSIPPCSSQPEASPFPEPRRVPRDGSFRPRTPPRGPRPPDREVEGMVLQARRPDGFLQ